MSHAVRTRNTTHAGMRVAPAWLFLLAALALLLAGCSAADTTDASADSAAATTTGSTKEPATTQSSDTQAATSTAATDQTTQEEDVSHQLPYEGMSGGLIDKTWLGPHDDTDKMVQGGQLKGSIPYQWRAQNGTGDMVFTAYVRDGIVIKVSKFNMNTTYWIDASGHARSLPDRSASGASTSSSGSVWTPTEDPSDYSSPDEYADNAEDEFAAHGCSNPWDEAYAYWEGNAL